MDIRLNKRAGRLEIRNKKRMVFFSCYKLEGSYYVTPAVRIDVSRAYREKCVWFFFMGMFLLIDIFKIKD